MRYYKYNNLCNILYGFLKLSISIIIIFFHTYSHAYSGAKIITMYKNIYIPDIPVYTKNGEKIFLNTQQDQLSLLFFWEPWSCTSVNNIEKLYNLKSDFYKMPLQIILLSQNHNIDNLYNKEIINKFTIYFDPDRHLYNNLKIQTLPTAFLVNTEGKILSKFIGDTNWNNDDIRNIFFEHFPHTLDKPKNNFIENNSFVKHIL